MKKVILTESEYEKVCQILGESTKKTAEEVAKSVVDMLGNSIWITNYHHIGSHFLVSIERTNSGMRHFLFELEFSNDVEGVKYKLDFLKFMEDDDITFGKHLSTGIVTNLQVFLKNLRKELNEVCNENDTRKMSKEEKQIYFDEFYEKV